MKDQRRKQSAFTLLEMLISVTVFAFMAAMAYGSLSQIIRSSDKIKTSNETLAALQFTLSMIERDLLQFTPRPVRDEYGDEQAAFKVTKEGLILSRLGWDNFIGAQRSHVQRVEYVLIDEQLVRQYWLSLDQGIEQKPVQAVLMKNINFVSFSLVDNTGKKHADWPSTIATGSNIKAKALEINIGIKHWGELKKLLELVDNV